MPFRKLTLLVTCQLISATGSIVMVREDPLLHRRAAAVRG